MREGGEEGRSCRLLSFWNSDSFVPISLVPRPYRVQYKCMREKRGLHTQAMEFIIGDIALYAAVCEK